MSLYSITPADFAFDARVKDKHRQVMLAFGVQSSRKHWIKLSQQKMADQLGVARETVNRAVKDLVEWGYIEKRTPEQTGKSICFYRIVMSRAEPGDETEELAIEEASDQSITSDQVITGGCDPTRHRGVISTVTGGVTPAVTHIRSSLRSNNNTFSAGARESAKAALAPPARALASIEVLAGSMAFDAWITHLVDDGQHVAANQAKAVGKMTVSAKYPKDGDRVIHIEGLQEALKQRRQALDQARMLGEAE